MTSSVSVWRTASARKLEAQRFHASDQAPLPVTHFGQASGQPLLFPAKPGPVLVIVDILTLFSAPFAENIAVIRRKGKNNLRIICGDYMPDSPHD